MRFVVLFALVVIVASSITQTPSHYPSSAQGISNVSFAADRSVPLTIKIVFLGLNRSSVNSTYLTSFVNLPSLKYQSVLAGSLNTGVAFNFNFQLVFADNSTVSKFASFLNGIGIEQDSDLTGGTPTPPNLPNPYFSNSSTTVATVRNFFYDANKVQSWLSSNLTLFGGSPVPGYTLLVADLHNFGLPYFSYADYQNYNTPCRFPCGPSKIAEAHYYNRTVTDPDLGLVIRKHYMTGWGGDSRFYYLDLSAGPSYDTNELPVQVAARLRNVDLASAYGKTWITEYAADYVYGAINNLFAADQIYPVNYSQKYSFQLFVIDNRTSFEKSQGPRISSTLNVTIIKSQLASILPFSNVTVLVKFTDIASYPGLASVIANSTTHIIDPVTGHPVVDARPVWNWLSTNGQGHISQFINVSRTTQEIDIPAFIFAFNNTYNFGFTIKDGVFSREDPSSIFGVALGDMVLISHGQADLRAGDNTTLWYGQYGRGVGFTRSIIHELGHMIGLMHPFQYDQTEDFTNSVMAYYPDSSTYSQFDKDTILRGVNDELLIFANQTLASIPNTLLNSGTISQARASMAKANQLYNSMDYSGAVQYSLNAALEAASAQQFGGSGFLSAVVFVLIGVAAGSGIGLLLGYLLFRRRTPAGVKYNRCPTCQQPTRWDPVQMHWYCDRCQKPV